MNGREVEWLIACGRILSRRNTLKRYSVNVGYIGGGCENSVCRGVNQRDSCVLFSRIRDLCQRRFSIRQVSTSYQTAKENKVWSKQHGNINQSGTPTYWESCEKWQTSGYRTLSQFLFIPRFMSVTLEITRAHISRLCHVHLLWERKEWQTPVFSRQVWYVLWLLFSLPLSHHGNASHN